MSEKTQDDGLQSAGPKEPRSPFDPAAADQSLEQREAARVKAKEIGGPQGPEPTRYGDWDIGGKCVDF